MMIFAFIAITALATAIVILAWIRGARREFWGPWNFEEFLGLEENLKERYGDDPDALDALNRSLSWVKWRGPESGVKEPLRTRESLWKYAGFYFVLYGITLSIVAFILAAAGWGLLNIFAGGPAAARTLTFLVLYAIASIFTAWLFIRVRLVHRQFDADRAEYRWSDAERLTRNYLNSMGREIPMGVRSLKRLEEMRKEKEPGAGMRPAHSH